MKVPKRWLGTEPVRTGLVSLEPHLHAKKLAKESTEILLSMSFLAKFEAAAASAVVKFVSESTTTLHDWFMDKISASNSLEQIHGTLNDLLERLLANRDACQNRLQRHKNKMPTNTYNNWVCRVMEIEEDVKDLKPYLKKSKQRLTSMAFSSTFRVLPRDERYV
ncbi:hypothetical protein LOK49_LG08G01729 [Camellia lanceoleosa]|uniref:Uncharacterized protein n=1 Tax=Camellia lanceoleosa TaxID=1840588 RepID=A0ACC0GXC2_9ERIC|nr:hypothetical protein LOK49_LG08G01729 [Camellia lanceoleosa]